jgi:hypothetical protein
MTKSKNSTSNTHKSRGKVKRPGIHAKTKQSSNKTSKNYTKPYTSQGK